MGDVSTAPREGEKERVGDELWHAPNGRHPSLELEIHTEMPVKRAEGGEPGTRKRRIEYNKKIELEDVSNDTKRSVIAC